MSVSISVIIPAYNEASRIAKTLAKVDDFLRSYGWDYEIIVVDDGSSDGTTAKVSKFIEDHPQCRLLVNLHRGKGFAVRVGMLAASKDLVLFMDADLATPIDELRNLVPWAAEHGRPVVIASREGAGAHRIGEPLYRHLMGRIFNFWVQFWVLPGIRDSQCGFKLFKREAAREIFGRLKTYGEESRELNKAYVGAFDVEVLLVARKLGYKIKEVPVTWTYAPTRHIRPVPDSFKMAWDVIKAKLNDVRGVYSS